MVAAQIDAVFEDIRPDAVKIGMVSSANIIAVIAERLRAHEASNIVLDPVMVATSGSRLIAEQAVAALIEHLVPLATVITPNMPEAQVLCGFAVEATKPCSAPRKPLRKTPTARCSSKAAIAAIRPRPARVA